MATQTTNLNLKKPDSTDYYNVQDFNDNMDLIDAGVFSASNMVDTTTGVTYKWGVSNGLVYIEEVEHQNITPEHTK